MDLFVKATVNVLMFLLQFGRKYRNISISSPIKDKNNDLWIHKDFIGNKNWNNSQAIKDLLNGKTLNDFSRMFDEAIDSVKGLDI